MASNDPLPPEYDSGEDVIEVAYTPLSSNYLHRSASSTTQQQQPPPPPQPPQQQQQQSRSDLPSGVTSPPRHPPQTVGERFAEFAREEQRLRAEEEQRAGRSGTSTSRSHHRQQQQQQHHHHHHHRHHQFRQARAPQQTTIRLVSPASIRIQPSAAAVIDLTEEPDSPPTLRGRSDRHSHSHAQAHRHPRRTNSQRVSPPNLERSDGSSSIPRSMRMSSHVIDLTADSPEDDQPIHLPFEIPRPPSALRAAGLHHHHHHHHHAPRHHAQRPPAGDEIVRVDVVRGPGRGGVLPDIRGLGTDIRGLGRRLAGYLGAEIIGYHALNAITGQERVFHQEPPRQSPKPALEEPPEARPGFTRGTNAEPEDDHIVVCPCCEEELAYDPKDTSTSNTISSSSKKRKRSPGEHHFWALKTCGHVCN